MIVGFNMKNDLVSIIVPIYNSELYLEKCIYSLINQSYKNIEIILVNDGSSDRSLSLCRKYQKIDNRIIVIDKENSGVSDTRNVGINMAHGIYILFVDSDDYLGIDSIRKLVEINNDDTLVSLGHYIVSDNSLKENKYSKSIYTSDEIIYKILSSEVKGISWGYLFDAKLIKNILFDKNTYYLEDMLLLIQYFKLSKISNIIYLDCNESVSYNYVYNSNSITVSNKNLFDKCKKIFYSLDMIEAKLGDDYQSLIENKRIELLEINMRFLDKMNDIKMYTNNFGIKKYNYKVGKKISLFLFSVIYRLKMNFLLYLYFNLRKILKIIKKGL